MENHYRTITEQTKHRKYAFGRLCEGIFTCFLPIIIINFARIARKEKHTFQISI